MTTYNEALLDAAVRHQVLLLRFSKAEVAAAVRILEASDRELLARLTSGLETDMSQARTQALLTEIRRVREQLVLSLQTRVTSWTEDLARSEAEREEADLEDLAPVPLQLNSVSVTTIKALAGSPINGVPLEGWLGQMVRTDVLRIEQAIRLGVVQGETKAQIVKRVMETTDVTRQNASTIVRTTVNHISNASSQAVWEANADILEGVRWSAMLDGRTSPVCRSRDGVIYPVNKGPRPPAHPNCRSRVVPVVKGEKVVGQRPEVRDVRTRRVREMDFREEAKRQAGDGWSKMTGSDRNRAAAAARRDWIDRNVGSVPSDVTYDSWLRRQPKTFQDEVLGPSRGKLFRDGLSLDKFVDERGDQYTLDELKQRSSRKRR